jgi:hypothetical protein
MGNSRVSAAEGARRIQGKGRSNGENYEMVKQEENSFEQSFQ